MSQFNGIFPITIKATGDIKAEHFVGLSGVQAKAGWRAYGVSRSDAKSGDNVVVDAIGSAIVVTGGAITAGEVVQSDDNGAAIVKTSGVALGRLMPGEVATAAGQKVEIIQFTN